MSTAPYDLVNTAINTAKVRLNDAVNTLAPISGKLIENTQAFTQQVVNASFRKMQEFLADLRYSGLNAQLLLTNVGAAGSTDPASEPYINYANYFDGQTLQATPILPQNFIRPYELWERQTGTQASMTEMDEVLNGLPSVPKSMWQKQWEWRDDALYIPGALVATDLKIRFAQYFADFVDITGSPGPNQVIGTWYQQPIPIMRCVDAFADYMCREISIARGDSDISMMFQSSAEGNARLLVNRDTAQPKSILKAAEYGKMSDKWTPNSGPDTQPVKR